MSGEGESIADIQPALSSLEQAYQVVREAGGNMTSYSQGESQTGDKLYQFQLWRETEHLTVYYSVSFSHSK